MYCLTTYCRKMSVATLLSVCQLWYFLFLSSIGEIWQNTYAFSYTKRKKNVFLRFWDAHIQSLNDIWTFKFPRQSDIMYRFLQFWFVLSFEFLYRLCIEPTTLFFFLDHFFLTLAIAKFQHRWILVNAILFIFKKAESECTKETSHLWWH